jgi:hypothetical protein
MLKLRKLTRAATDERSYPADERHGKVGDSDR